jgi:AraC-like DNA-binding protein
MNETKLKAKTSKVKSKVNWGTVDWNLQDIEIARQHGISRERVRQVRKKMGVGKSPRFHCRRDSMLSTLRDMDTSGLTLEQIAEKAGCSEGYALQVLRREKKAFVKVDRRVGGKYDWDSADWSKSDEEVARILGVKNSGVVTQYRRRKGIVKRKRVASEDILALSVEERENMTSDQIAERFNCTSRYAEVVMKRNGLTWKK